MPLSDIAVGSLSELGTGGALRAGAAELIATFVFVFIGEGSTLAFETVSGSSASTPTGLLIAAITHGFAIYAAISISLHVSGGHVNPAVTLGLLLGGHITAVKALLYVAAQLVGAVLASLLLLYVTNATDLPVHALGAGISATAGVVLEIALTFILLYTIYATFVDRSSKSSLTSAPLTVGLAVAAIILAAGPFSSASMNPARSFGPALVAADFTDHWVYWVGPLVGGAAGAVVYDLLFISTTHAILPSDDH